MVLYSSAVPRKSHGETIVEGDVGEFAPQAGEGCEPQLRSHNLEETADECPVTSYKSRLTSDESRVARFKRSGRRGRPRLQLAEINCFAVYRVTHTHTHPYVCVAGQRGVSGGSDSVWPVHKVVLK